MRDKTHLTALGGLSFSVGHGEVFGLLSPNSSGVNYDVTLSFHVYVLRIPVM